MAAPDDFNYSRAVREWCFVQLPLFDLGKLRTMARDRGLADLGLHARDPWETLDREGLFAPVAYARHGMWPYDQPGCLEVGDLAVREEVGHRPWAALREEAEAIHGEDANPQILYHHWQLFWLDELQARLAPSIGWGNLGEGLESFYEHRSKMASIPEPLPLEELRTLAANRRAIELLLIRVQNVFFPFERGGPRKSNWTGSHVSGLTDDAIEWSMDQLRSLDYPSLAADCGVSDEDLARIYEALATEGLRTDPNAGLFDLLDQVRRPSREKVSGAALRAVDYYDAARIIRSWHRRLVDEWLPDIDELRGINGTAFKENRYGTLDVRGNRAVLPIILEEHDLYPWRVQLISEGASEIAALRLILEEGYGLSFETLGISTVDLGGSGIPEKTDQLLAAFREYANYFLLVFDAEGNAKELIEELERRRVIEGIGEEYRKRLLARALEAARQIDDPDAKKEAMRQARDRANDPSQEPGASPEFTLWKDDFETDNFSSEELCGVITTYAKEVGLNTFEITAEELDAELAGSTERGAASVLLCLAVGKEPGFQPSKPEFARRLARFALENPTLEGVRRGILDLAEHLVMLTWADRRLVGSLRDN